MFHVKHLEPSSWPDERLDSEEGALGGNAGPPGVAISTGCHLGDQGKAGALFYELSRAHAKEGQTRYRPAFLDGSFRRL